MPARHEDAIVVNIPASGIENRIPMVDDTKAQGTNVRWRSRWLGLEVKLSFYSASRSLVAAPRYSQEGVYVSKFHHRFYFSSIIL